MADDPRRPDPSDGWGPTTRIESEHAPPAAPPAPPAAPPAPPAPPAPVAPAGPAGPAGPAPTVTERYLPGPIATAAPPTPAGPMPPPPADGPDGDRGGVPTDELPLGRRVARKVRRGDQRDALRDAVSTVESKVPADFRVAIATGVFAIVAAIVQQALFPVSSAELTKKLIGYGLALAFLALGIIAVRSLASELSRVSTAKGGRTAAQAIRVTTLLVGYLLVILVTLGIIDVRLGNLLVGGALTGVVIGIAAQQALGNVFAGLVLLFSRPYVPGEHIRVNSGSIGGPHDGVVVSVGLTYTVLLTSYGPLNVPNAQLLAAAIGPQPPDEDVANGTGDDAVTTAAAAAGAAAGAAAAAGTGPTPTGEPTEADGQVPDPRDRAASVDGPAAPADGAPRP